MWKPGNQKPVRARIPSARGSGRREKFGQAFHPVRPGGGPVLISLRTCLGLRILFTSRTRNGIPSCPALSETDKTATRVAQ